MDLAEVTIGEEDGGGGVAMCGRVMWRRTAVARSRQLLREAVAVPLVCARWRGRQGETSGAGELAREER